jgi:uncharacterized protein DUF3300
MRQMVIAVSVALALLLPSSGARLGAAPTPAELDKLLAPIALYPDQLLAHMLLCAANPGRVAAMHEWLASQQALKGTALQDAAVAAGFDDDFVALALFPDVIGYMATQAQWTASLGKAFTDNRSAVFDSIQRLRAKAKAAGTLKSTPQQQVETQTTSSGQQVIVVEPANPQVVYVPQYNPQTVYTTPTTTTVVVEKDSNADAVAAGVIGFTAGIAIGAAMDNNYYYGPYGWHGGGYMYNDAWDDYYDAREDAREDWQDHREDMGENRSDRAKNAQEQRTERSENRTDAAGSQNRSASAQSRSTAAGTSQEARGYSGDSGRTSATPSTSSASRDRSGTKSDAFSGYSSGKSERAASSRGKSSRSSSRSGGSRRR